MKHTTDSSLAEKMTNATAAERADALFAFMETYGDSKYDESVTQLEHGLQTAALAKQEGAAATLVTAALFHDLGHLLVHEHSGDNDFLTEDHDHETVAAEYLQPYFSLQVTEPIRLHVPSKRYLCSTDPSYYDGLSKASKRSFELQGGNMNDQELAAMRAHPHLDDALQLRRWDDRGKVAGLDVPSLESYREPVLACLLS